MRSMKKTAAPVMPSHAFFVSLPTAGRAARGVRGLGTGLGDPARDLADGLRGLVGRLLGVARGLLADRAGLAGHRGERLLGGVVGIVDERVDARVELLGVGLDPR